MKTSKQRFKPQSKRISALWGIDNGELVRAIKQYVPRSVAIIPLPNCLPYAAFKNIPGVSIMADHEHAIENLAGHLSVQVETHSHVIVLLPQTLSPLAKKALSLADTVISIGTPPRWIPDNVGSEKLWETDNTPVALARIARRLTGHTVGLALSSGGGKGLAHLGVLKVLSEEDIPIDIIAGTSAGAFFGVHLALGRNSEQILAFANELQNYNRWVNWDINVPPRSGLLKGAKAKGLIARMVEHKRFEDLSIPFFCVATDINTGEEIVFDSGSLADAIRASLSIPFLANPWHVNQRYFIDGAFVDPIPAKLLREKGADIIVASSVIQPLTPNEPTLPAQTRQKMPNFLQIITNIQNIVENQLVNSQLGAVDVMIHTKVQVEHALDFSKAREIIAAGETAARAQIPTIRACLETPSQE